MQAVRGNALKRGITTSKRLAAELQQRPALTCSRGSIERCLPPEPPFPWLLELSPSGARPGGCGCVCMKRAGAFQGVGVN